MRRPFKIRHEFVEFIPEVGIGRCVAEEALLPKVNRRVTPELTP